MAKRQSVNGSRARHENPIPNASRIGNIVMSSVIGGTEPGHARAAADAGAAGRQRVRLHPPRHRGRRRHRRRHHQDHVLGEGSGEAARGAERRVGEDVPRSGCASGAAHAAAARRQPRAGAGGLRRRDRPEPADETTFRTPTATDEVRRRPADPPARGSAAAHRQGPLPGRPDAASADLVRVRALAARACADPLDRHRGSVARAWRGGGVHRDRLCERRHRHAEGGDAAQEARRLADVRAATSRAGRRSRALCRRSGGDGDRRDAGAGEGCRRTGRGGLRAAALGDLGRRGGGAGCAACVGRERRQHLAHHRTRQPRGDRGGVRAGGAHREAPLCDHARPCAVHGAARRDRHLRSGGGSLHAVCRRELSAPRAQHARQHGVQGAGEQRARGVPRRRRRLRRQGLAVCRAPADAVGGAQDSSGR